MTQKITPNLWFANNAREAAEFYVSVFPMSKILSDSKYPMTETEGLADFQKDFAGKDLTISYNLAGHDFLNINAGPAFKPSQANSFMVNFDPKHDDQAVEHIKEVWAKLTDGGEVMMELQEYPFSKLYGWVRDKYGYGWQLMLTNPEGEDRPCIIPSFLFNGAIQNRAKEAIEYYVSVFKNSKVGTLAPYPADQGPAKAGTSIMFGECCLDGEWITAMDSGVEMDAPFTEAVSLSVTCKDQAEIDYFWEKLSKVPEFEQCGWCKDQFGVSWQIVPENVEELLKRPNAFKNMMQMHKLEIDKF